VKGTLALSWGRWGGFYASGGYGWRVCAGWIAVTYLPIEIDDMAEAYAIVKEAENERRALGRKEPAP
jgi:hypothetical protein